MLRNVFNNRSHSSSKARKTLLEILTPSGRVEDFFLTMSLTLYAAYASAPCRMAIMALEICGKEYNCKIIDLMKGEQYDAEYLKVIII